jgi:hypothetical protein
VLPVDKVDSADDSLCDSWSSSLFSSPLTRRQGAEDSHAVPVNEPTRGRACLAGYLKSAGTDRPSKNGISCPILLPNSRALAGYAQKRRQLASRQRLLLPFVRLALRNSRTIICGARGDATEAYSLSRDSVAMCSGIRRSVRCVMRG